VEEIREQDSVEGIESRFGTGSVGEVTMASAEPPAKQFF